MAEDRNWLQGPLDAQAKVVTINGIAFMLVADLPEGGFVQMVNGENPLGQAMPGPQLAKGSMVLIPPLEIATNLRAYIKQTEAAQLGQMGKPFALDGMPVPESAFTRRPRDLDN